MAGNKDSAARGAKTQADRRAARAKEAGDAVVGKGPKPGFGTESWAKAHGVWKEGDTSGPPPKADPPAKS